MNATKKEVDEIMNELSNAMHESLEASKVEQDSKLRRIKAHKRLQIAKDTMRSLSFNQ